MTGTDPLEVRLDHNSFMNVHSLRYDILEAFQKLMKGVFAECGWNNATVNSLINVEGVYGKMGFKGKTLDNLGVLLM